MKREHQWGVPKECQPETTSAEMGSGSDSDSASNVSSDNHDLES